MARVEPDVKRMPARQVTSAPARAEYTGTGDVCPNRPPRKTWTFAPPTPVTGGS